MNALQVNATTKPAIWQVDPIKNLLRHLETWQDWFTQLVQELPHDGLSQEEYGDFTKRINEYVWIKDCEHPEMEYVYFRAADGSLRYQKQCTHCYHTTNQISKKTIPDDAAIYPRVEVDRIDVSRRLETIRRKMLEDLAEYKRDNFKAWYGEYLQSPKWQEKRRKVLERDHHLCQACLVNRATQVHHKTYDHVGDEPLFELVSVCDPCHDKITQQDRARNGRLN